MTQKEKKLRRFSKCPQKSQKQQGFFSLAKNPRHKYSKNRKNNKKNKIQDLEKEEAKKGLEISPNAAKIAKATRIFFAS